MQKRYRHTNLAYAEKFYTLHKVVLALIGAFSAHSCVWNKVFLAAQVILHRTV